MHIKISYKFILDCMKHSGTSVKELYIFFSFQEMGSSEKKVTASDEWRNMPVEDRLEYALVRVIN